MHTISPGRFLERRRSAPSLAPPLSEFRPPSLRLRAGLCALLAGAADALLAWQERAAERTALASLDDRMLKDIGLSRADAARESRRPFWRV